MSDFFSLWPVTVINTLGQLMDSFLFVDFINHYFPTRSGKSYSLWHKAVVTALMTAAFFLADLLSRNEFYWYYGLMLVLPLLYATFFFGDRLPYRWLLCSLFTILILSFEQLVMSFTSMFGLDPASMSQVLPWFFFRRICLKFFLLYLERKIFIWPRQYGIILPPLYWIMILLMSVSANLILTFFRGADGTVTGLLLKGYVTLMPVLLLLIIKNMSMSSDRARTMAAQMESSKIQNQYLRQQIDMTESLRKFRHDYKSHLFGMDALLMAGKYEELHQYLMELHQYQYEGIHLRRFCDDEALNIILNQKASVAEKAGIVFECNVALPREGRILINDLNSLIVNLCDNAIEACALLPEPKISLDIYKSKAYLIVEVSNTCPENILEENPSFRTTKCNPSQHGLGLQIVRSIADKYHGQVRTEWENGILSMSVVLLDE